MLQNSRSDSESHRGTDTLVTPFTSFYKLFKTNKQLTNNAHAGYFCRTQAKTRIVEMSGSFSSQIIMTRSRTNKSQCVLCGVTAFELDKNISVQHPDMIGAPCLALWTFLLYGGARYRPVVWYQDTAALELCFFLANSAWIWWGNWSRCLFTHCMQNLLV